MLIYTKWTPSNALQNRSRSQVVSANFIGDICKNSLIETTIAVVSSLMPRFNCLCEFLSNDIFRFPVEDGKEFAIDFRHEFVIKISIWIISQVDRAAHGLVMPMIILILIDNLSIMSELSKMD